MAPIGKWHMAIDSLVSLVLVTRGLNIRWKSGNRFNDKSLFRGTRMLPRVIMQADQVLAMPLGCKVQSEGPVVVEAPSDLVRIERLGKATGPRRCACCMGEVAASEAMREALENIVTGVRVDWERASCQEFALKKDIVRRLPWVRVGKKVEWGSVWCREGEGGAAYQIQI
ncbi:hypothetical protein GYMLUDRAFT_248209 [Collybiopsis luxurians FD-317 M1]|uniref:Uncharacterized protein n=1 Tax=Collybiopsis luxurians FD-317 M1 TaxID=944289 RepID=A0A0D0BMB1_9AGAR|nr:hypothetical protein GYMLUDRAFT_248209 [Collybiopsis luxurians FD-317 M1]